MKRFTLIELLMVIAIIGILTSILLPSLGKARRAGKTALCINNLKQIALATQIYDDDFSFLPKEMRDVEWDFDYIMSQDSGIWECPEDQGSWGYAYNGHSPMEQHGKTTYEAQGSSYVWNGFAVSRLYNDDGTTWGRLQQNDMSLYRVIDPVLYTLVSGAPIRGTFGNWDATKHLWHFPGKTKWPMSFADGHAQIVADPRAVTEQLMSGQVPGTPFVIDQKDALIPLP